MDSFLKHALNGQQYSQIPLLAEGSDRRYTRIIIKNPNRGALTSKAKSWILACSPLIQQKHFLWRQADFLKAGLQVPKLHPSHLASINKAHSKKGFLLIEDLGDQSLEKEVKKQTLFPYDYYFQALDQLIQLQKTPSFFQTGQSPVPWTKQDLLKEMFWTEKYLIEQFLNYPLKGKERESLLQEWSAICEKLTSATFRAGHRDFHSRNLFIKNKKVYMIDFQDAGFFPQFYDLVSLIYDVYVESVMDNTVRKKLLDYFISKHTLSQSLGDLEEEITRTALQRLFQAVGRFASFYCVKNQSTHLKYIYSGLKLQKELLKKLSYPAFLSLTQKLLVLTQK